MPEQKTRVLDRTILALLLPLILMTVSNSVTTGYIGRLAISDISAYGVANRIYNIYYSIFAGLAIGVMIVNAKIFGKKKYARFRTMQEECDLIILPIAILFAVAIALFPELFLKLLTDDQEMIVTGSRYLRVVCIGMPFVAMTCINASAFQARGNARVPLLIAIAGNVVNITIGYILIFGVGEISGIGLQGAGIAQDLSQVVMCGCGIYMLYSNKRGLFSEYLNMPFCTKLDREDTGDLLRAGIPAAAEDLFWQLATVVVSRVILSYGQDYYAAYQIGLQAESFCDMMGTGFVTASMSLSAMAIGRNDGALFRQCYKRMIIMALGISAIMTVVLGCFGRSICCLLTDKEVLVDIAVPYLKTMMWVQVAENCQQIMYGYLRTTRHEKMPMAIKFIGIWVIRVSLTVMFGWVFHTDILFIWCAIAIDQWSRFIMACIAIKKGNVLRYADL
jgi:putative MATE family efflux protein